ncbi:MAG: type II secretion system protein GspG [Planctomycetes bacterium]|jgi:general secretion pathway protein G|nr:type II secretion system protein GspG [Planctomycetota bacterium]
MTRRLFRPAALALTAGLAALLVVCASCGGGAKKKASKGAAKAASSEPEAPKGPSPAAKAFQAMLGLAADAPAEAKAAALSAGYLAHLERQAVGARDALVLRLGSEDPAEAVRKRMKAIFGPNVEVKVGDDALKEFEKKADEAAKAEFGIERKELESKEPEELRDLWLAANWAKKICPPLKDRFLASEHDLADRVLLVYEGSGRRVEIAMEWERKAYRYAGTWEDRNDYLLGPERTTLFDLKSEADRMEAAQNEMSELASGLLRFKQKQERYPTGVEGLDALLENPGGPDATRWEGPYAHHVHDPWGNRWRYGIPGQHMTDSFDLWSAGPDGKDGTADDLKNW